MDRFRHASHRTYTRSSHFIKRRPLASFLLVLGLLLIILILGKVTQQPAPQKAEQKITKNVKVYSIGDGPQATYQAKVEKSGVVQIIAQTAGVVQRINLKEGEKVNEGQQIISLSSNYQGGNASSVQTQIAQTQYQNVLDTFADQNELIEKQKAVATQSAQNAQDVRDIARHSIDETNDVVNNNQTQLDQMSQMVKDLQANNTNGANDQQISTLQGSINQLQGGVNQLRQAQRTTVYQSANNEPPATLANLQKDVLLKQLAIQAKSLSLNKEVSRLQVNLAYVNEALMYPASPFTGVVERVNVKEGQLVNPGTVLATVTAADVESTAVLLVPQSVAQIMAMGEPSQLVINNKEVAVTPYYISSAATDGQLYSVFYTIPKDRQKDISDGDYVSIKVPIGTAKTTAAAPIIPIDAVYQTQDKAYVLVANKNKAVTRTIQPGEVFGSYVAIESGLQSGDQIIMDRNVIAEDNIKISAAK